MSRLTPAPLVYLVRGENTSIGVCETSWTVGIYSSKAKAERARAEAIAECRELRPELKILDVPESGYNGGDWDREYSIESRRIE